MNKRILVAITLLALSGPGLSQAIQTSDSATRVNDIQGSINVCGLGGKPGILAFIPGRSFSAYTDELGRFRLSNVPPGTYQLSFSQFGTPMGSSQTVNVTGKNIVTLDAVNVCVQAAACPSDYAPVCGADGVTYLNYCEAERAHVAIASGGECVN